MAAGRFAPGHLGELTQVIPFDLVDALLDETRRVQRRLWDLPSRVEVYFLLAMCLFPELGYRLVWSKLTAALTGGRLTVPEPTAKSLRDLRRRVGAEPMRRLFEVLAGPLARPTIRGVRFGPFRMVSFDGCSSIKLPDSERNAEWFGPGSRGGYPMLELMTLVEIGTRALIGAVSGPTSNGETAYARQLLHHLGPDMLVLWDKGFDANAFLAAVADADAKFLGRFRANRRAPVLARLADGSYLSVIGAVPVRVVEAQIAVICEDGTSCTASYRLVTTLNDAAATPPKPSLPPTTKGGNTSRRTTRSATRSWTVGYCARHRDADLLPCPPCLRAATPAAGACRSISASNRPIARSAASSSVSVRSASSTSNRSITRRAYHPPRQGPLTATNGVTLRCWPCFDGRPMAANAWTRNTSVSSMVGRGT
ncbi:transposase domain-containing protein [Streptomyces sp. NPDC093228]|uniref:transposase domain-containing protein n=1 Tax=Streptomyces sp. NPDC093228 TaxID=3155070 RepID=UPI00344641D0